MDGRMNDDLMIDDNDYTVDEKVNKIIISNLSFIQYFYSLSFKKTIHSSSVPRTNNSFFFDSSADRFKE